MDCSLLQGYFVIARLCLMYFHCLFAVQPEDVESSPVRAPPTETPTFYTQTDDEDWAESSGDDMLVSSPKGERSRPFQAFTRVIFKSFSIFPFFHVVFFNPQQSYLSFWPVIWAIIYSLDDILHHEQSKSLQIIWFAYADFLYTTAALFMLFKVWQIHHDICLCFQSLSDQREPLKTEMWVTESDLFSCLSHFLLW